MVRPGMMISDRYEIIEKIGSGGMADVFRAKCHRLNRFVAIKFLKQEYCQDTKFVNKFHGEAQSVAGLSHPNIVSIFDVGEDQGFHYIVMEFVEGITLKKYINDRGKLTVKEAVGIGLQIAAGLNAAHSHNIIHRDIKPQNILISRDGTAKVTDFGIAKAASSNTITSNAMGSVHYISPEQARGGFSNEKSDIYSLGVTMYEMLSGTLPFNGESTVAIALAHIQDEATPLAAMDATIPVGLSNIVAKAMQKKQELRYDSAASMIADLKMFLSDPTGQYGVITPLEDLNSPTIFIKDDELDQIRKGSRQQAAPVAKDEEPIEEETEEEEEEEDGEVDSKLDKVLVFGSIGVAIVIGIIIIALLGKFVGLWGGSTPDASASPSASSSALPEGMTTVPDVTNLQEEAAKQAIEKAGLVCKIEEEASSTVPEGNVISCDPNVGTQVAKNTTVTLKVSKGGEDTVVPDVAGYSVQDAQTMLTGKGFKVKVSSAYSETIPEGKVAYTDPKAGASAAKDSVVTIYQSKGPQDGQVTVPTLTGLTEAKAKAAIKSAGLTVGNVSSNYSSDYASGKVCAQSLKAGSKADRNTAVDITISLGKENVTYQGSIDVENLYEYESDPVATFKFVLSQDGKTREIKTIALSYGKFPYRLSVTSSSDTTGTVIVYMNGKRAASYSISFSKQ